MSGFSLQMNEVNLYGLAIMPTSPTPLKLSSHPMLAAEPQESVIGAILCLSRYHHLESAPPINKESNATPPLQFHARR